MPPKIVPLFMLEEFLKIFSGYFAVSNDLRQKTTADDLFTMNRNNWPSE
jgi:hypothetical protein